jgi:hypothetical protein
LRVKSPEYALLISVKIPFSTLISAAVASAGAIRPIKLAFCVVQLAREKKEFTVFGASSPPKKLFEAGLELVTTGQSVSAY